MRLGTERARSIVAAMVAVLVSTACGGSTAPGTAATPAAAATAAGAAAAPVAATAQAKLTVRVGMLSPNLVSVINFIAKKTGAYEKNNLVIQETPFSSGQSTAGTEELIRGNLDVYIGAGAEVARINSQALDKGGKAPLVVLTGGTPGVTTFVLRSDVQAKSLDELKGKPLQIGVSSASSIHLALFRGSLLDSAKLTTEQLGWKFVSMQAGDMITALTTKQIDGFMHSEPTTSLAIQNKVGYVFMNGLRGDMGPKAKIIPVTFTSANRDWVTKNPEATRRFMKALKDANDAYAKMPKADMVAIMAEWARTEVPIVSLAYDRLDPRMDMSTEAARAWWDIVGGGMRTRGETGDKLKFEDVFDLSYQAK